MMTMMTYHHVVQGGCGNDGCGLVTVAAVLSAELPLLSLVTSFESMPQYHFFRLSDLQIKWCQGKNIVCAQ